MTQKTWRKKLKLNYSKDVIDIIQFGSSVFLDEVPRDIDIAVIFRKIPLKEQLSQSQKIKKQISKKVELPVHIKSFDLEAFFDKGNFAREGILFYGWSVISGKNFAENFGLSPRVEIYYSLRKLEKKDKIKFNYMLNGRGGEYGLLRRYGGVLLKPGLVEISPENEIIFVEKIRKIVKDFEVRKVFIWGS